jgi:hypothetical protein
VCGPPAAAVAAGVVAAMASGLAGAEEDRGEEEGGFGASHWTLAWRREAGDPAVPCCAPSRRALMAQVTANPIWRPTRLLPLDAYPVHHFTSDPKRAGPTTSTVLPVFAFLFLFFLFYLEIWHFKYNFSEFEHLKYEHCLLWIIFKICFLLFSKI